MIDLFKHRIVCVGANMESEGVLQALIERQIPIAGLVTSPGRPEVRGSDYRDLAGMASDHAIELVFTEDINSPKTKSALRELNPDYIFILGWSQLLDKEVIGIPRKCVIGSHPSRLPYGAGRAPVPWTILEGLRDSAVTFFEMTTEVDAGEVFLQKEFIIPERVSATTLYQTISAILAEGFVEICSMIDEARLKGMPQAIRQRTVRARRVYEDGLIDFHSSAREVDRLIRAVTDPYPGAFTYFKGHTITVWQSTLVKQNHHKGVPGQVLKKTSDALLIQCGDEPLWLTEFSVDGVHAQPQYFRLGDRLGVLPAVEIHRLNQRVEQIEEILRSHGLVDE